LSLDEAKADDKVETLNTIKVAIDPKIESMTTDLVLDVRFLPNPFFVEELKPLTGNDPRVRDYVLGQEETQNFLKHLFDFLDYLLPLFMQEGKTHLTLAIGCTGGQHRSVVIANVLAAHLTQEKLPFTLHHREVTPKES